MGLDRIRAILRDYGMHEPECPARQVEKAQAGTGVYLTPAACTCWLAEQIDGPVCNS